MKTSSPLSLALASTLAAACASAPTPAPTPTPSEPAAAPVEPATPVAAPAPEPRFPYPWMFHATWETLLVVTDDIPESWLAGPPVADAESFASSADRPLDLAKLPKSLTSQIGRELEVATIGDVPRCRVKVTGLRAHSWTDPEGLDDLSSLYTRDAEGNETPLAPSEYAAALWKLGRRVLVADFEVLGGTEDGCDRPYLAAPAAEMPTVLTKEAADAATVKRALAAVRSHALWAEQEDVYQRSLDLARKHRKALSDAGYTVELPKRAPAHWDTPSGEWTEPAVTTWRDASGKAAVQIVEVGNGLACGAPRAWFAFDADFASTLAFGLSAEPELVLDLDRDGSFELGRAGYPASWIERLTPDPAGGPSIVRETYAPADAPTLWCAWEQVPPLETIDEVLHPKPAQDPPTASP